MGLRLGDDAPNFKAQTTEGEIDFYEFNDKGSGYKSNKRLAI